jgi:hypothetical protein
MAGMGTRGKIKAMKELQSAGGGLPGMGGMPGLGSGKGSTASRSPKSSFKNRKKRR